MEKPSVNIIKIFNVPRHGRLENLWNGYCESQGVDLHVFNNGGQLCHADALAEMWRKELNRPGRYTVFTEFDFLPGPEFLLPPDEPVLATEYCTRSPETMQLENHGIPGAWFVAIDKEWAPHMDFSAQGKFNDPANGLRARLIPVKDCYPRHYGVSVEGRGEHLFWSRHYNDPLGTVVAGFELDPILEKVDDTISDWLAGRHR